MSSFLQPFMLWGLALASVPILIHLLNRRRYQTVKWAAMHFLKAAFKKNQRRLRLESLLLLLVRTALIVLLVLALARPFLAGKVARAFAGGAVHYTLVLDNSYSMGLNEGVTTPFKRAVEESLRIVGTLRPEDSVTLYLTNDNFVGARPGTPRAIFRNSHDAATVESRIQQIRVSTGRATLDDVLALVADGLDPRTPEKHVVVLTDLQRNTFENPPSEGATPKDRLSGVQRTIRDILTDMSKKGASVEFVDVGAPNPGNLAILDFGPVELRPLVKGSSEPFAARVVNYGPRPERVDVKFAVDDSTKGSVPVSVPAARGNGAPGTAEVRFRFPDLKAGPRTFLAKIPADSLPVDDTRRYVGIVRQRIRVLAVDGDPQKKVSATFFLKRAIALKEDQADRIDMDVVDPLAFENHDLAGYDLVILANVDQVRDRTARKLEDFVRAGGGLVVFLGDKVDPQILNRALAKEGEGLLPGTLADHPILLEKGKNDVRISLDAPPHPLFKDVLGATAGNQGLWAEPRVWGYYRVTVPKDDRNVTVLLRMTDPNKSPALLERVFGKGRVLLFTTSADVSWSNLPATFVMPVIWHQMVYYLTAGDPLARNLLPFAAFRKVLPKRTTEVQITTPNGGRVNVPPIIEKDEAPRIDFRDTEQPGRYVVSTSVRGASAIDASTKRGTDAFAVNVDAKEGDIRRIPAPEVSSRFAGTGLTVSTSWSGTKTATEAQSGGDISRGLLAAVLALLFLELFLARRFGDTSRLIRRKGATA